MLSKQDQLTELVRDLETGIHIFATDPLLITEKMQGELGTPLQKLHRRAERIDSNNLLRKTLNKIEGRIRGIIIFMSILWCVSGFLGLFTLLQTQVVNFFYVLVCLLGFHTLMLLGWILLTLANRGNQSPSIITSFINPRALLKGKDDVTTGAVNLYERQINHAGMRWYLSKFSHQLWLATLAGMLISILFLLVVRQYSFSWESTLLSDEILVTLTHWLGWLPNLVGFNVPDAQAIAQSRLIDGNMPLSIARQWASLLIGSLIMYGILPRTVAWLFCAYMFHRRKMTIDINLPYYQKIINFWQREVVDKDDYVEKIEPVAPIAQVTKGAKVVALLEYPFEDEHWYQFKVGHDVTNFGILDSREDMQRLLSYLDRHDVQVMLGVQQNSLPDRGTMRKLDKIATHAKSGLIIQLLDNPDDTNINEDKAQRLSQWKTALTERNIGIVG